MLLSLLFKGIVIGISVATVMIFYSYFFKKSIPLKHQIIYLNGPSSAGKSTLARALQNKLKNPYLLIGIDQMITMMPEKLNDWHHDTITPGFSWQPVKDNSGTITAYKIVKGPFGTRLNQALKDIVITLARSGHYLIIDDVSFGNEQVNAWQKTLRESNVLWVGVTAPFEILKAREKARGDRKLGGAGWQAERVHVDVKYDLMIDTHDKTLDENTDIISQLIEPGHDQT